MFPHWCHTWKRSVSTPVDIHTGAVATLTPTKIQLSRYCPVTVFYISVTNFTSDKCIRRHPTFEQDEVLHIHIVESILTLP
jgi:hypothetical protein